MCLLCLTKPEDMEWMNGQLRDVPDEYVVRFAAILWECAGLNLAGPSPAKDREQAVELLAGYFGGMRREKATITKIMQQALGEALSSHGHAA